MANEQAANKSVRLKLSILVVDEVKTFGEAKKKLLNFYAKVEGQSETLKYTVFNDQLFTHIQVGATIEADVVTKKRELPDGQPTVDRYVNQVYADGRPVAERSQRRWGGGLTAEDRASAERQTALRLALDSVGTTDVGHVLALAETYARWMAGTLKASPLPLTQAVKTKAAQAQEAYLSSKRAELAKQGIAVAHAKPTADAEEAGKQAFDALPSASASTCAGAGGGVVPDPPYELTGWDKVSQAILGLEKHRGKKIMDVLNPLYSELGKLLGLPVNTWQHIAGTLADGQVIKQNSVEAYLLAWRVGNQLQ